MTDSAITARLADAALYRRDKAAWARAAAPRWITRMRDETDEQKRESWRIAGPELKAEIRRIAEQEQRE